MLEAYRQHVDERSQTGILPLPLNAQQVTELVALLKNPPAGEEETLVELITHRVPPGVDAAAYVKAGFLTAVANGEAASPLIDPRHAIKLLGTMLGGYNIDALVRLLEHDALGELAATELMHTLLMFDAFHDVAELAEKGNAHAQSVLRSWAEAEWFTRASRYPNRSSPPCSRSRAKPTPTTCRQRQTLGPGQTSRCMPWRCTRCPSPAPKTPPGRSPN